MDTVRIMTLIVIHIIQAVGAIMHIQVWGTVRVWYIILIISAHA